MRTRLFFSFALALSGAGAAGCSLVYNGAHYQGGAAIDTGMGGMDSGPGNDAGAGNDAAGDDAAVDGGPGIDGGSCHDVSSCPTMGTYCDIAAMTCRPGCDDASDCVLGATCNTATHMCSTVSCTSSAMCMGDTYCHNPGAAGACAPCDGDGDHYYAADAGLGCARLAHLNGGDCDDTNVAIYPGARIDCSTSFAESCPIGISFITDPAVTVHELGISPENVVFADSTSLVAPRGPLWVAAGNDANLLPSGVANGYVGFVGQAMDGSARYVYGVPLTISGAGGAPEILFDDFQVGTASFSHVRDGATGDVMVLSAVATPGASPMGLRIGPISSPGLNWRPQASTGYATTPFAGGGQPAVGGIASVGTSALVGLVGALSSMTGGNPTVIAGTPAQIAQTGPANFFGGTWIASSGTAALWIAESSSSVARLGVWNGAEVNVSPPEITLDSFTSSSPVTILSPNFRGDLDSRQMGGAEHFIAVVPIAATTTPATGRLAIVRWSWPIPSAGEPVAPHLSGALSDLTIHELDLGASRRINGFAGAAVVMVSDLDAFVAYQDNTGIVVRPIGVMPDTTTVENPPTLPMIHQGSGETFVGVDITAGLYPQTTGPAIGRLVVAAMVEHGTAGSIHEIRVRAVEACVTMP